ncbi:glycoside hydrolase family 5 protein [Victivallis vadensis]|uniref:Cellulase (Glycosyl hydrolase family 5) n=2 Tax=Victivallis vadensis TaxID=172901 RepID=A0A2U1B9Y6_9BACT|nr:hypothetical protein [Victivallis vadensis]PVY45494.1 hypothetical protein C8D82_10265 [Victivallis vadensis]
MRFFSVSLFSVAMIVQCAGSTLDIDRRGALSLGGKRFEMVFFNPKWVAYPQYTPMPGYYRIENKNAEYVKIALNFPEAKNGTLVHRLQKTAPSNWTLRSEVDFPEHIELPGVMSLRLPGEEYRGVKLKADGTELLCPPVPSSDKKAIIFRRQCRELRIPDQNGEWILKGDFHLLLQDNRCFRNGKDFELRLSFTRLKPPARYPATLDLDIEYRTAVWTALDLREAMNMGVADEVANDGSGGWTDQGSENDLRMLWQAPEKHPREFTLTDPAKNGGKGCIMLRGKARPYFPESASVELTGKPHGNFLYLLHALAWRGTAADLGTVTLIYADDSEQDIQVCSGREADNWWQPSPLANGSVAWIGENTSSYVGLYRSMFPIQNKPIAKIIFQSAGNAVWGILAATVGDFEIPRKLESPSYILENSEWKKLSFDKDILKGSVLDFSARLDAPAGKYGPVVVRNGRFEFRDRPGQPARFYGTNLCSQAVYPEREWAERLADRIARAGFNAIRLHHHDALMVNRQKTTELEPAAMERLDYFLACLKKRGIYVQTDLFISRRPAAGEIPGYNRKMDNFDLYKALFYLQEPVFENWKGYVKNYLNHMNPYTGSIVKDDPMFISLGLINEGNINKKWDADPFSRKLYLERFKEYLAEHDVINPEPALRNRLFDDFLTEIYFARYARMVDFVRSLDCHKPLSDQNMGSSPKLASMRSSYDFVDNHLYFNHPEFAGKSWGLPSFSRNHSVLQEYVSVPAWLFQSRIFGKPFIVTEFDFARPNPHRSDGALLFGVYGALQQWDGLFQFAYAHGMDKIKYVSRTDGYFDLATDPVKLLSQYLGVAFFLNGELENGNKDTYYFMIPEKTSESFEKLYPAEYAKIGLCARIGGVPEGQAIPVAGNMPASREELRKLVRVISPDGCFRTADGNVVFDSAAETFEAVTPQAEAFILPAGETGTGRFCRVGNHVGKAVVGVISVDSKPLRESGRMLVLHLTDSAATKMRYADQDHRKLEEWGTTPFLAARGEAVLTFSPAAGRNYRLFAVDTAGKRLAELPLNRTETGGLSALLKVFNPFGSVFAYELEARP